MGNPLEKTPYEVYVGCCAVCIEVLVSVPLVQRSMASGPGESLWRESLARVVAVSHCLESMARVIDPSCWLESLARAVG